MDSLNCLARIGVCAAISLIGWSASAAVVEVDFEDFDAGTIIDDEYAGDSLFIRIDNFNNDLDVGVVFDTDNITGRDFDLEAPFLRGGESLDPGKVLIIQENGPCSDTACDEPDDEGGRDAGLIVLDFDDPVILHSIDFFDIEEPESMGSIKLFDTNDDLIPLMFAVPDTGGDNTWDSVIFEVSDVGAVEILMGGSGAIDNIRFTIIPLPASVWLFASGLLLLAGVRRRLQQ